MNKLNLLLAVLLLTSNLAIAQSSTKAKTKNKISYSVDTWAIRCDSFILWDREVRFDFFPSIAVTKENYIGLFVTLSSNQTVEGALHTEVDKNFSLLSFTVRTLWDFGKSGELKFTSEKNSNHGVLTIEYASGAKEERSCKILRMGILN